MAKFGFSKDKSCIKQGRLKKAQGTKHFVLVCTKQDQSTNREISQVLETAVAWNTHICKIEKINFFGYGP